MYFNGKLKQIVLLVVYPLIFFFFIEIYMRNRNHTRELLLMCFLISLLVFISTSMFHTRSRSASRKLMGKKIDEIIQGKSLEEDQVDGIKEESQRVLLLEINRLKKFLMKKEKTYESLLNIVNTISENTNFHKLLEDVLGALLKATESSWGAIYIINPSTEKLELKVSSGFSKKIYQEFDINIGEGLIGNAVKNRKVEIIQDLPDDTIYTVRTFLGTMKPKSIISIPVINNGEVEGTIFLANIKAYTQEQIEIVETLTSYIGISITNGMSFERSERLSKTLDFQSNLIQSLNEDLEGRVNERTGFLKNTLDSILHYGIYSMDKDGFIITWNKGAELITGYKEEFIVGKHVSTVGNSEDIRLYSFDKLFKGIEKEGKYTECVWYKRKDGTKYFADIAITSMFSEFGDTIGYTCVIKDITATKNMECAVLNNTGLDELIIDNMDNAMLIIDSNFKIEKSNKATESVLEIQQERLTGILFHKIFREEDFVYKNIEESIKHSVRGEWVRELKHNHKPVTINATPIAGENEKNTKTLVYIK